MPGPTTDTTTKLAMATIARAGCNLVRDRGGARGRELPLSAGALAIGDALTGTAGHVQLDVPAVWVDLHDLPPARGSDDDDDDDARTAILIGVRATPVVRWASVATAGVDTGIFGVWDAAQPPGPGSTSDASTGFGVLLGRPVMALETGDGWFPAVIGIDADGAVSVVIAGPGVDLTRFKIPDPAEVAAPALPLGPDSCPVTNWLLSGLDATTLALARTHAAAFAPPSTAKRFKPQQLARLGLVATWALQRWHALLAPLYPAEASVLTTITVATKGKLDWLKPARELLDYTMSGLAFDREQVLLRTLDRATLQAMKAEVTPARLRRVGNAALDAIRTNTTVDHERAQMLQVLGTALYASLVHHAYAGARPDAGAALDAALDRLDEQLPPAALITRLAGCK